MKIWQANVKELRDYINIRAKDFEAYDYDYFWSYQRNRDDESLKQFNNYLISEDEKVVGWAVMEEYNGISIINILDRQHGYEASIISLLSKTFPNSIFQGINYSEIEKVGLKPCNAASTIGDQEYIFPDPYPYTNGDANILRDAIEKQYVWMKEDDISEIEFLDLSTKEINNAVCGNLDSLLSIPYARKRHGFHAFPGFHYFVGGDDFYNNEGVRYLIAKQKNGKKCAGVIRYGEWPYTKGTTSIAYIDVAYGAREQGLARRMIQELGKRIDISKPFRIGRLSEMGAKAHIDQVFKDELPEGIIFIDD